MSDWKVIGQVGKVEKLGDRYCIHIAENKYKPNEEKVWEKVHTVWFHCYAGFKPRVIMGDSVIAEGEFVPDEINKNSFIMKINHIGVISRKEE